jgi:superfamily II DNA or RNA helicase
MAAKKEFVSYEEAKRISRKLEIKTKTHYNILYKAGRLPEGTPSCPDKTYSNLGWTGWNDFLGTLSFKNIKISYNEAKEIVARLGITTNRQYVQFYSEGKFPEGMIYNPESSYAEWVNWGTFLGREVILSYEEAKVVVKPFKITGQLHYSQLYKDGQLPKGLPSNPYGHYAIHGWINWFDFLGKEKPIKFVSFDKAKSTVKSLGIQTYTEYRIAWFANSLPKGMPASPHSYYKKVWRSTADFYGTASFTRPWNSNRLIGEIEDLLPLMQTLEGVDLYALLMESGMLSALMDKLEMETFAEVMQVLRTEGVQRIVTRIATSRRSDSVAIAERGNTIEELGNIDDRPQELTLQQLHDADEFVKKNVSEDFVKIFVARKLNALRNKYFDRDDDFIKSVLDETGGIQFNHLRDLLFKEIQESEELIVPQWRLHIDGVPVFPSRMQKFVAAKLIQESQWSNWSGVGAGKTAAAGLAAFAIGSKLTVVIANNSNVDQWGVELDHAFSGVHIHKNLHTGIRGEGSFVIINFEKFQGVGTEALIDTIVRLKPDLLVIDEVQLMKRRDGFVASKRSINLNSLRQQLTDTKVLTMSATPVINHLSEGVSLLEATRAEKVRINTKPTTTNALALYTELYRSGIRYRPNYGQVLETNPIRLQNDGLLGGLRTLQVPYSVLTIEQMLLETKLEGIRDHLKQGTIIYTQFVTGIVPAVKHFVESLGLSCETYVGEMDATDREAAKDRFIACEVDVLIGSSAMGVGVDGLQQRCDRLIVLSLPWTSAAYDQLLGRVYRQGSKFHSIEVVIPQVLVSVNGENWSWDEQRLAVVESKRTLSDAAVDGVMPDYLNLNQLEFTARVMEMLQPKIENVEAENVELLENTLTNQ